MAEEETSAPGDARRGFHLSFHIAGKERKEEF